MGVICCGPGPDQTVSANSKKGDGPVAVQEKKKKERLSDVPVPVESKEPYQYKRRVPDTEIKEKIGHGAERDSMNCNGDCADGWFARIDDQLAGSPFPADMGLRTLKLQSACWMNPGAVVANISKKATSVSIYMYHAYGGSCNMSSTVSFKVKMITEEELFDPENESKQWVDGERVHFPPSGWEVQPRDEILRELICEQKIDREHFGNKKLVISGEVYDEGGWKSDWYFQALAVVEHFD